MFMTERQKILVGVEATNGVEQTALSVMMVERVSDLAYTIAAPERREAVGSFGLTGGPKPRAQFTTATITGGLVGNNTVGQAPSIGPLLRACGLSEVATPATDVVYTPISTGQQSVTIKVHEDGQANKLIGAMGNLQIRWEEGDVLRFSAQMTGHYTAPIAEAMPANAVGRTPFPVIASGMNVAQSNVFGATNARIQSFELDLGNRIFARDLAGGRVVRITDRAITGTVVVMAPTLADKNYFSQLTTGSVSTLLWEVNDQGSAPDVLFDATSAAVLTGLEYRDVDGLRFYALAFRLVVNTAGDGEFVMTIA